VGKTATPVDLSTEDCVVLIQRNDRDRRGFAPIFGGIDGLEGLAT
jgi:hypothetical protein